MYKSTSFQICYYSLIEQITRELDKENLTTCVFSDLLKIFDRAKRAKH